MKKYLFDFLLYLKQEKNASPQTVRSYFSDLEQLFDFLNDTDLAAVDHQRLRQFIAHLIRLNVKKSSIARKLSSVRAFFAYLNRIEIVANNPAKLLATPRQEKRLPAVLTVDDALRLIEAPHKMADTELRDRAVLEILYSTGIRASELVGINHEDINRHDNLIRIRGKGRKERIVPVGSKAMKALDAYLACRSRPAKIQALFTNKSGKRLTARTVQRILENYRKKLGLPQNVSPHTLRHSFATHMLESGADLRAIQELLGHASLSSTQVYTHITMDRLRAAHAQAHPRGGSEGKDGDRCQSETS